MNIYIDSGVKEDCWNLRDSYGEICVGCGCCSDDCRVKYESRIRCLEDWLEEAQNFDLWDEDPKMRKLQERNIKHDIKYYKRSLRYYKGKLNSMGG